MDELGRVNTPAIKALTKTLERASIGLDPNEEAIEIGPPLGPLGPPPQRIPPAGPSTLDILAERPVPTPMKLQSFPKFKSSGPSAAEATTPTPSQHPPEPATPTPTTSSRRTSSSPLTFIKGGPGKAAAAAGSNSSEGLHSPPLTRVVTDPALCHDLAGSIPRGNISPVEGAGIYRGDYGSYAKRSPVHRTYPTTEQRLPGSAYRLRGKDPGAARTTVAGPSTPPPHLEYRGRKTGVCQECRQLIRPVQGGLEGLKEECGCGVRRHRSTSLARQGLKEAEAKPAEIDPPPVPRAVGPPRDLVNTEDWEWEEDETGEW